MLPPRIVLLALALALAAVVAAAGARQGRVIPIALQRFLLLYSGVFALIALTAAVGAGLLAADRIALSPGQRIVTQAVHRAVSLVALAALGTHILLEILAHKAQAGDAFVPFLAHGRTFYMGAGTIASDLVVLVIATGIVRKRFAGRAPWAWRFLHAAAYLAWPLSIMHGLRAGRQAKPYVDWSYGACLAAVALALLVRYVMTLRGGHTAGRPVPRRATWPAAGALVPASSGPLPAPGALLPAPGGLLPAPGGLLPAPGGLLPGPGGLLPAPGGLLPGPGALLRAHGAPPPARGVAAIGRGDAAWLYPSASPAGRPWPLPGDDPP